MGAAWPVGGGGRGRVHAETRWREEEGEGRAGSREVAKTRRRTRRLGSRRDSERLHGPPNSRQSSANWNLISFLGVAILSKPQGREIPAFAGMTKSSRPAHLHSLPASPRLCVSARTNRARGATRLADSQTRRRRRFGEG